MTSVALLDYLSTPKPVRIFVPLQSGERVRLNCVAKLIKSPRLEAEFGSGLLPINDIDLSGKCLISYDTGGPTLSLYSTIEQIEGTRKLKLIAIESVSHEQKRQFFRVDAELNVRYWLKPLTETPPEETFSCLGLNISGGGILLRLNEALPKLQRSLGLEIYLPEPKPERIRCVAQVIRAVKKDDNKVEAALQFEKITPESRDKIVAFCFAEQRKQLRFRVRVASP